MSMQEKFKEMLSISSNLGTLVGIVETCADFVGTLDKSVFDYKSSDDKRFKKYGITYEINYNGVGFTYNKDKMSKDRTEVLSGSVDIDKYFEFAISLQKWLESFIIFSNEEMNRDFDKVFNNMKNFVVESKL